VRAFAVHPGSIFTELAKGSGFPAEFFPDTLELVSALILHLAAGKADWLNGWCVLSLRVLQVLADTSKQLRICVLGHDGVGERLERKGVE
jgi:hypothetical protein